MRKPVKLSELGALSAKSRIEICGNREAVIEGCCGILEYGDGVVRIRTQERIVRFTGRGLVIRCMTEDALVVTGYILQIEFME
jgi:sporulation protein YqfC